MLNEILNQIDNIDKKDREILEKEIINNNDVNKYIKGKYNHIIQEWHKKYNMFDIPNGLITISINGNANYYNIGLPIYDENIIFDIASETKLYTEIILFSVIEEYNISLNTKISQMTNKYKEIKDLSIMDLISFNNTYYTKIDIRECKNKEDALNALNTIYIDENKKNFYLYTDLPIMVLTNILEEITNKSYKELFDEYIIKKYNLKHTYLDIDDNERYITLNKKYVNDPKANIFNGYYGHSGVKTTSKDFITFINEIHNNDYYNLFITKTNTLNNDGSKCKNKGLIGNSNLSVLNGESLASKYLPKKGFAIQGSVRCHCETYKLIIKNKEYIITTSIFLDLYTQYENSKKYEKETGNIITKIYNTDYCKGLKMIDIREILPYYQSGEFKEIVNMIAIASLIEINNFVVSINNKDFSY